MKDNKFKKFISAIMVLTVAFTMILPTPFSKVLAAEGTNVIKIACVGDSLTEGYLSSGGNKGSTAYPARLQVLLGEGYEVKNFGKTSKTLMKGTNASYWNTTEYKESMAYDADIVIVMLGTNDSKGIYWNEAKFKEDAVELMKQYESLESKPKVIFAKSPQSYQKSGTASNQKPGTAITAETVTKMNAVQNALIEENGWETVDMYALTANRENIYHKDKLHFSDEGYSYIAECMYEAIKALTEIENDNNLVSKEKLNELIAQVKDSDENLYTSESFATFKLALEKAQSISEDKSSQQVEVDAAEKSLKEAFDKLVVEDTKNEEVKENKISVLLGEGAPESKFASNIDDIKNAVLTEAEINNGSSFDIELNINNATNITSEVIEKINSALESNEKIGKYLDIEMFKVINNSKIKVDNLNKKIRITTEIPSELLGKSKYSIIHNHNDKIEILKDLDSDDKTITFETDKFSIFAISYVENKEESDTVIPVEGENEEKEGNVEGSSGNEGNEGSSSENEGNEESSSENVENGSTSTKPSTDTLIKEDNEPVKQENTNSNLNSEGTSLNNNDTSIKSLNTSNVKTGDNGSIGLWILAVSVSCIGLVTLLISKRKIKDNTI